ncbi:22kda glycoprotein [Colletotrichum karsti]|uniref:22kda glycoprotein n=1 Tax=Colletotrichum karsti TaxID=1095194 RepID=A0A9P6ICG6_9PEZI|nr:22kda glycoprotein [Colletotrichum karsti]KAF9880100.1 22kda glycoprotein [Colletotrichum karsti]
MQFLTILASAAVASAAAIQQRDVTFKVSEFSAGCIPHSSQCSYSFTVIQPGTMETTGVKCSGLFQASGTSNLPDVKEAPCTDSSRTFDVVRSDAGLTLTVSQPVTPSSNQTGSHLIPNDQLVTATQPNAQVQSYNGPAAFDLE